jgi:hypothetical protein
MNRQSSYYLYTKRRNMMADNTTPADGYYSEDMSASKEDFDLSFLDEDETKE